MTNVWRRVEVRKEREAKEKAQLEAEAKRESMAQQNRYIGVLDKFIHELHEALSSFATYRSIYCCFATHFCRFA